MESITSQKIKSCVYIDEAGDLGLCRGTQWFVLTAVIIDKSDEKQIREKLSQIKSRLNVNEIHLRKITDFYKRGYIVRELKNENFTYINVIMDTQKGDQSKLSSSDMIYNYLCRLLLERVSWFLRDTGRIGDIVLSARGTSRDGELIRYIKEKLIPYSGNQLAKDVFDKVSAKTPNSWDMLQVADVCATTMFLAYEKNGWGFYTPCFSKVLRNHLYTHDGVLESYGIKYFTHTTKSEFENMRKNCVCK